MAPWVQRRRSRPRASRRCRRSSSHSGARSSVCSMTLDEPNMPASVLQAYEERFLFLLFLLRQPRARLIYVTSQEINPTIVDYYLGLLPGVIASHARRRLHLLSPLDGSSRPL